MRAYRCEENLDILKNTMATSFMNNADVPEMTSKTTFEWRTITVPCAATCGGGKHDVGFPYHSLPNNAGIIVVSHSLLLFL